MPVSHHVRFTRSPAFFRFRAAPAENQGTATARKPPAPRDARPSLPPRQHPLPRRRIRTVRTPRSQTSTACASAGFFRRDASRPSARCANGRAPAASRITASGIFLLRSRRGLRAYPHQTARARSRITQRIIQPESQRHMRHACGVFLCTHSASPLREIRTNPQRGVPLF